MGEPDHVPSYRGVGTLYTSFHIISGAFVVAVVIGGIWASLDAQASGRPWWLGIAVVSVPAVLLITRLRAGPSFDGALMRVRNPWRPPVVFHREEVVHIGEEWVPLSGWVPVVHSADGTVTPVVTVPLGGTKGGGPNLGLWRFAPWSVLSRGGRTRATGSQATISIRPDSSGGWTVSFFDPLTASLERVPFGP